LISVHSVQKLISVQKLRSAQMFKGAQKSKSVPTVQTARPFVTCKMTSFIGYFFARRAQATPT